MIKAHVKVKGAKDKLLFETMIDGVSINSALVRIGKAIREIRGRTKTSTEGKEDTIANWRYIEIVIGKPVRAKVTDNVE